MVEIRRAHGRRELRAAVALRHRVFCIEQSVPEHEEADGRDSDGLHLVAVEEGEVIGTCRLLYVGATAQFSRLAVDVRHRRRGIASALLQEAERETRSAGLRRMVLHAQTYAMPLYEQHGWEKRGRRFWEAGIEHIAMEKPL